MLYIRFYILSLFMLLSLALNCNAAEKFALPDANKQQQFNALITDLRCLVCQNQNLKESNAPLALDLKIKIYDMVKQEKTNSEIIDFLTTRYGDFVLYKPRLTTKTYLLYFTPLLLLAIGIFFIFRFVKRLQV